MHGIVMQPPAYPPSFPPMRWGSFSLESFYHKSALSSSPSNLSLSFSSLPSSFSSLSLSIYLSISMRSTAIAMRCVRRSCQMSKRAAPSYHLLRSSSSFFFASFFITITSLSYCIMISTPRTSCVFSLNIRISECISMYLSIFPYI
jgi:hypothetical protein